MTRQPVATMLILVSVALACTTGGGGNRNVTDIAAVVRELGRRNFDPLQLRDVETIMPSGRWSLQRLPYASDQRAFEDLDWESDDHQCGISFSQDQSNAEVRYRETMFYCTRPTRSHAINTLLQWLGEIDAVYAGRLRKTLPYLAGEIKDEFELTRKGEAIPVTFDVRLFPEGWTARIEIGRP